MFDFFYLNGYGVYVYSAFLAAFLPMTGYACWIYRYYRKALPSSYD